jgi:ParB-like chromosome segregation protein Spo0J
VAIINEIKTALHSISPMNAEPVDCVLWVPADRVHGNDYNPNSVAPPEMRLLELSIESDGYTQPIVTMLQGESEREVIDGFHRHIVGTHFPSVANRIRGYLPVVTINKDRTDKSDRIAATIRHNRARGKHSVDGMTDIVVELKRRNWPDEKIGRELGMEPDEVLRLTQISGLAEMFTNAEFTQSWDIDALADEPTDADIEGELE